MEKTSHSLKIKTQNTIMIWTAVCLLFCRTIGFGKIISRNKEHMPYEHFSIPVLFLILPAHLSFIIADLIAGSQHRLQSGRISILTRTAS